MSDFSEISPRELARQMTAGTPWTIVDVREAVELETAAVEDVVHIPLGDLVSRVAEVPTDAPVAVLCHSGMRSAQACRFLAASGVQDVHNVVGGIDQWSATVDPSIPRY